MITEFSVQNFGCLGDVKIEMTPIHALVGPNDSGKTTVLRALMAAIYKAKNQPPTTRLTNQTNNPSTIEITSPEGTWCVDVARDSYKGDPQPFSSIDWRYALIRWEPDQLKKISELLPSNAQHEFFENRGLGLPGIYDYILSRGDDAYSKISARFCELFPGVTRLRLPAVSTSHKAIEIELKDGTRIRPQQMSDGMLYFLAFAALQYIEPLNLIMIEEPENGLHPARIHGVMNILKDLAKNGTQVLLTTHSPLVINELEADQITVLWRKDGEGARSTLMKNTADFQARSEVFSLGELWLNYCNGIDEARLVDGD